MKRAILALIALLFIVPASAQMNLLTGAGGKFKAAAAPFTPASLPNLRVWYEARTNAFQSNACTTAATNGNPVGCVQDLSGNGLHLLSAADDTTRPTLTVASGKSLLQFNAGNSTCLLHTGVSTGIYAAGKGSVFVASGGTVNLSQYVFMDGRSSATAPQAAWLVTDSATSSSDAIFIRDDSSNVVASGAIATSAYGATHVVGITWDGTTIQAYVDGVAKSSVAAASGSTITLNQFALGCSFRTTKANFFGGTVNALVATQNVLTSTEISNLTTYLAGLQ